MISVTFTNDVENVVATEHLYQWDNGQKLSISGVGTTADIHFANKKSEKALVVTPTVTSGAMVAPIPNSLLAEPYPIIAYVYIPSDNGARTLKTVMIYVEPRTQPSDFVFEDDEGITTLETISQRANEVLQYATNLVNTAVSNMQTDYANFKNTIQGELDEMIVNTIVPNADKLDGLHANEIASNPNLLINPCFTVNQLGKTEYKGAVNNVDKWVGASAGTKITTTNGYKIGFVSGTSSQTAIVIQYVDIAPSIVGKSVTFTMCIKETTSKRIFMEFGYVNSSNTLKSIISKFITTGAGTYSITKVLPTECTNKLYVRIYGADKRAGDTDSSYSILDWVKLEISGLATPFVPPNHGEELLKIQAMDGTISANSVNGVTFLVGTATPQVTNPSAEGYVPEGAWYGQYEEVTT